MKYHSGKLAGILIPIFFLSHGLFIKSYAQSSEYRFSASLEKRVLKSLRFQIEPGFRFSNDNSSKEYLIDGGVSYKPIKYIDFGASYRFYKEKLEGVDATYKHRFFFSTQLKYDLDRFGFMARALFTNDGDAGMFDENSNNYMRYRLKARYNIKSFKFTPSISAEYFYQIKDREFNKARFSIGGEFRFNKANGLVFEYCWQNYLKKDKTLNIFSLGYDYNF